VGINAVRKAGSIRQAVEQGIGARIFTAASKGVDFVLAGSIDDGPLPSLPMLEART
jgi:hypothetical protein